MEKNQEPGGQPSLPLGFFASRYQGFPNSGEAGISIASAWDYSRVDGTPRMKKGGLFGLNDGLGGG